MLDLQLLFQSLDITTFDKYQIIPLCDKDTCVNNLPSMVLPGLQD